MEIEVEPLRKSISTVRDKYSSHRGVDSAWLNVYCTSIEDRAVEMLHARDMVLEAIASMSANSGATTTKASSDPEFRMYFYSTSFWALANSLYDIVAHAVNCVHCYAGNERGISFHAALKRAEQVGKGESSTFSTELASELAAISKSRVYKRLLGYRNCSLHRRSVCVQTQQTTYSVSRPYSQVATTSMPSSVVTVLVCDDPLDLALKFKKERTINSEVNEIAKKSLDHVRKIVRKI
jgi:hypothetical protein